MKTLLLTVVVHEGPMARAYLGLLHGMGYQVSRVVVLVHARDLAGGQRVAPWLPLALRRRWALRLQDLRMNHWSRHFCRRHGAWTAPWLQALCAQYALPADLPSHLSCAPAYRQYAHRIDELMVDDLNDPALAAHLRQACDAPTLLFTGGGLLRAPLLSLPGRRWLHVHPGHLPQVRGADGLLWSVLLRSRPGATAFYMAPGLDTGDIVLAQDLPAPVLPSNWPQLDDATRYRLLYAFVDPLLRAVALRAVLQAPSLAALLAQGRLGELPSMPQATHQGRTFRFMHPALRRAAFERLWELQLQRQQAEPAVGCA